MTLAARSSRASSRCPSSSSEPGSPPRPSATTSLPKCCRPRQKVSSNRFLYDERHVELIRLIRLVRERRGLSIETIGRLLTELLPDLFDKPTSGVFRPEMWNQLLAAETQLEEGTSVDERLVEAGLTLFSRRGYADVSIDDVCRSALDRQGIVLPALPVEGGALRRGRGGGGATAAAGVRGVARGWGRRRPSAIDASGRRPRALRHACSSTSPRWPRSGALAMGACSAGSSPRSLTGVARQAAGWTPSRRGRSSAGPSSRQSAGRRTSRLRPRCWWTVQLR